MWHYDRGGKAVGPVDPMELERLIAGGEIGPETKVWKKGMSDWVQAQHSELESSFRIAPPPPPNIWDDPIDVVGPANPQPKARNIGEFKDPTTLTKVTKFFLYLYIAVALVALLSGYREHQLLSDFQAGLYQTEASAEAAGLANDARQAAVGMLQLGVLLVLGIVFLKWIHRANFNARQLGAKHMEFTPGWSIGWYFVPFANLWKPYQAMREIWNASENPMQYASDRGTAILRAWWGLWLLTNALGNTAFRLALQAEEMNDLIAANVAMLVADFMDIPLSVVALLLVHGTFTMQMKHLSRSSKVMKQLVRRPVGTG